MINLSTHMRKDTDMQTLAVECFWDCGKFSSILSYFLLIIDALARVVQDICGKVIKKNYLNFTNSLTDSQAH